MLIGLLIFAVAFFATIGFAGASAGMWQFWWGAWRDPNCPDIGFWYVWRPLSLTALLVVSAAAFIWLISLTQ